MGKTYNAKLDREFNKVSHGLARSIERHLKEQGQVAHMREETHCDTLSRQRKALRRLGWKAVN